MQGVWGAGKKQVPHQAFGPIRNDKPFWGVAQPQENQIFLWMARLGGLEPGRQEEDAEEQVHGSEDQVGRMDTVL